MRPNVMIQTPHFRTYKIFITDASRLLVRFSQIRKGFFEIYNERSRGKAAVLQMEFVLRSFAQEPMAAKIYNYE
jgi:hypothetical protein